MAKDTRLSFTVDGETEQMLEDLARRTKSSSKAEVLQRAVGLLEAAVEAQEKGHKVGETDDEEKLLTEYTGIIG